MTTAYPAANYPTLADRCAAYITKCYTENGRTAVDAAADIATYRALMLEDPETAAVAPAPPAPAHDYPDSLVNHLDFNDAAHLLKADVGADAVVKTGSGTVTTVTANGGLGNLTAVNGEGRSDGAGAINIPSGQFLAITHGIGTDAAHPWCMVLRVKGPSGSDKTWRAIYSLDQSNEEDAELFVKTDNTVGRNGKWNNGNNKGYASSAVFTKDVWHTLVISATGKGTAPGTSVYFDGNFATPILTIHSEYVASIPDSLAGKPSIYISWRFRISSGRPADIPGAWS